MYAASRQPPFVLLVLAAWALVALQLVLQYWPETALTLNDTDDAMRLTQLQAFLAGHGWFDLHEPRMQPPLGYDSHWSRVIDAGLAGMYLLFRPFADPPMAERLMRVTWPLLWLLPAMAGIVAIAWRMGGRMAATVALLLVVIGLPAVQQFKPGRIDHHNVQIAIAVLAVAAAVWSDRRLWLAAATGALTGLGLAIGLESVLFLLLGGVAIAVRYLADEAHARSLRAYGIAVSLSVAITFLITVSPPHWTRSICDTLAINSAGAVVIGGLGLVLVSYCRAGSFLMRCELVGAVALGAGLYFLALEPRCIAGPYAMLDPAVKPIWFSYVRETQSLATLFRTDPATALGIAAFPAAGVIAIAVLLYDRALRHDIGALIAAAALALGVAMMLLEIRALPYAIWFAMPAVAGLAPRLFAMLHLRSLVPRFLVAVLLTPTVISASIITAADAVGLNRVLRPNRDACFLNANYAPFKKLASGLVAADADYGPFLLALTGQSILAAPYHRSAETIAASHWIFARPPEDARRIVRKWRIDYLAICGPRPPDGLTDAQRNASLWGHLTGGAAPDWLTLVPKAPGQAFTIYRVRS